MTLRRLLFLALGMFAVGCNAFQIASLLPEISQTIGMPIPLTGQGITSYGLAYLLCAPILSLVLQEKPMKAMTELALVIFITGNLITLLSTSLALFITSRALVGAGVAMFIPLSIAYSLKQVKPDAKGRVLSFIWGANSAGVVLGVPFGLYLTSMFYWQVSIGFNVCMGMFALFGLSREAHEEEDQKSYQKRDNLALLFDKKTALTLCVSCMTGISSLGLFSYIALLQTGNPHPITLSVFSWGLGGLVGSTSVGFFIDKTHNASLVMTYLLIGLLISILSIPFTTHIPCLNMVSFFMWGMFGWGVTNPQQQILLQHHQNDGTFLAAINNSAFGLGSVIGTASFGVMLSLGISGTTLPFASSFLLVFVLLSQISLTHTSLKECST